VCVVSEPAFSVTTLLIGLSDTHNQPWNDLYCV